jgi:hypothetical protein
MRVTLLKCSEGFDDNHMCKKIDGRGADLDITINTQTKSVLTTLPRNPGALDLIFDQCSVVDAENWRCGLEIPNDQPLHIGMAHGRF